MHYATTFNRRYVVFGKYNNAIAWLLWKRILYFVRVLCRAVILAKVDKTQHPLHFTKIRQSISERYLSNNFHPAAKITVKIDVLMPIARRNLVRFPSRMIRMALLAYNDSLYLHICIPLKPCIPALLWLHPRTMHRPGLGVGDDLFLVLKSSTH